MTRRFLSFQLGDNDFGSDMRLAMEHLWAQHCDVLPTASLDKIKQAIVHLMVGSHHASWALRGLDENHDQTDEIRRLTGYLGKARMLESDAPSTADGDHSYVSIDLSTGYIWIH